jgi:hypothetical protein
MTKMTKKNLEFVICLPPRPRSNDSAGPGPVDRVFAIWNDGPLYRDTFLSHG